MASLIRNLLSILVATALLAAFLLTSPSVAALTASPGKPALIENGDIS